MNIERAIAKIREGGEVALCSGRIHIDISRENADDAAWAIEVIRRSRDSVIRFLEEESRLPGQAEIETACTLLNALGARILPGRLLGIPERSMNLKTHAAIQILGMDTLRRVPLADEREAAIAIEPQGGAAEAQSDSAPA